MAEKGCIQYELKAFQYDENKFAIIERWASEEDLAAHGESAHMQAAMAKNHLFRAKPVDMIKLVNT